MCVIEKDEYGIPKICKKCGHFPDCPEYYECPPLALISDIDIIINYHKRKSEE